MRRTFRPHATLHDTTGRMSSGISQKPKGDFSFSLPGVECNPILIDQLMRSWTRLFMNMGYLDPHNPEVQRNTAIAIGAIFATYTPEQRSRCLQLMHQTIDTVAIQRRDAKKDGD